MQERPCRDQMGSKEINMYGQVTIDDWRMEEKLLRADFLAGLWGSYGAIWGRKSPKGSYKNFCSWHALMGFVILYILKIQYQ